MAYSAPVTVTLPVTLISQRYRSRVHEPKTQFRDWLSHSLPNILEAEKWQDGTLERRGSKEVQLKTEISSDHKCSTHKVTFIIYHSLHQ